jgi:hypothetical protein
MTEMVNARPGTRRVAAAPAAGVAFLATLLAWTATHAAAVPAGRIT